MANDKQNFEDVIDGLESARQDFEEKSTALKKEAAALRQELSLIHIWKNGSHGQAKGSDQQ